MSEQIDPIAVQAFKDYGNALSIAKKYWPNGPADVQQAAAATVLIHMKQLRTTPQSPSPKPQVQAVQASAPASARPAPAAPVQGGGIVDECPKCKGPVWDNRPDIKPGERKALWRCKNKECKDQSGYTTSEWSKEYKGKGKQANTAYAQAHAIRETVDQSFDELPAALSEPDDLPF